MNLSLAERFPERVNHIESLRTYVNDDSPSCSLFILGEDRGDKTAIIR